MKKSKYYNKKTNGYDSRKESARAGELQLLQENGYINQLEEQKKFELQPSFKIKDSKSPFKQKTIRAITYIVDFYYYDNEKERWIAEDVKGFKTEVYKIKSKMFQYIYKDILFLET